MKERSDQQKLYADIPGDYNPIDEIFEPAVRQDISACRRFKNRYFRANSMPWEYFGKIEII